MNCIIEFVIEKHY